MEELRPEVPGSARAEPPQCLSLAWSADGRIFLPDILRTSSGSDRSAWWDPDNSSSDSSLAGGGATSPHQSFALAIVPCI